MHYALLHKPIGIVTYMNSPQPGTRNAVLGWESGCRGTCQKASDKLSVHSFCFIRRQGKVVGERALRHQYQLRDTAHLYDQSLHFLTTRNSFECPLTVLLATGLDSDSSVSVLI